MAEEKTTPEFTPIEEKAFDQGWKPQDQWEGNPDDWRPAKEFLDRGELFKKIDDQARTIKEFRKTLDAMAKHHASVRDTEYKRALDDLKQAKKEALTEGDADKIVDIDERIQAVKDAARSAPIPQVAAEPVLNPVFNSWVEKNSWYESNKAMRAYADRIGNDLAGPGVSAADILSEVERQVKKEFPHKFNTVRREQPNAVEGGGVKGGGSKKESFTLSDEERRVMQRLVRSKVLTEDQYIADLKRVKGVS